jgi:ABC-type sugar transport system permease subunit
MTLGPGRSGAEKLSLFGAKQDRGFKARAGGVLSLYWVAAIAPLLWLVWTAFAATQSEPLALRAYAAIADPRNVSALANSLVVAGMTGVLLAFVTAVGGLALCFCGLTGLRWGFLLAVLPLCLPDIVVGVVGRALVDPGIGLLRSLSPSTLLLDRTTALMLVAGVVALKWAPLAISVGDYSLSRLGTPRLAQAEMDFGSFWLATRVVHWPKLRDAVGVMGALGLLIGFRQHELAVSLTSSGAGFASELWAPWNQKVLFSFAEPHAAALQALPVAAVIGVALLAGGHLSRRRAILR